MSTQPVNCGTSFCSCIECVVVPDEAKLNRTQAEEFENWCKESDDGAEPGLI